MAEKQKNQNNGVELDFQNKPEDALQAISLILAGENVHGLTGRQFAICNQSIFTLSKFIQSVNVARQAAKELKVVKKDEPSKSKQLGDPPVVGDKVPNTEPKK